MALHKLCSVLEGRSRGRAARQPPREELPATRRRGDRGYPRWRPPLRLPRAAPALPGRPSTASGNLGNEAHGCCWRGCFPRGASRPPTPLSRTASRPAGRLAAPRPRSAPGGGQRCSGGAARGSREPAAIPGCSRARCLGVGGSQPSETRVATRQRCCPSAPCIATTHRELPALRSLHAKNTRSAFGTLLRSSVTVIGLSYVLSRAGSVSRGGLHKISHLEHRLLPDGYSHVLLLRLLNLVSNFFTFRGKQQKKAPQCSVSLSVVLFIELDKRQGFSFRKQS